MNQVDRSIEALKKRQARIINRLKIRIENTKERIKLNTEKLETYTEQLKQLQE